MRLLLFIFILIIALCPDAFAQSIVKARGSEQDGYSRLVFEWGESVPYTVDKRAPDALVLSFQADARLDSSSAVTGLENIEGLEVLSTKPLKIRLAIPRGAKSRTLTAAGRVIVDVYDGGVKSPRPAGKAPSPPEKKPAEPVKVPAPSAAPPVSAKEAQKLPDPVPAPPPETRLADSTPATEEIAKPKEVAKLEKENSNVLVDTYREAPSAAAKPIMRGPSLITISTTESSAIAVFERAGQVWLVNDRADLLFNPQISGPDVSAIEPILPRSLPSGGKAFTAMKPENAFVYGEEGGLLWRLVFSPEKKEAIKPVMPVRQIDGRDGRGGTIIWPFKQARTILDMEDPVTGRMMKIVTVGHAKDFTGPTQDYVDFSLLSSPVGMAIVPKVDDLDVSLTRKGVTITRPGGLALAVPENIEKAQVNQARQENELRQPVVKGQNVFDFSAWQMGGIKMLDQNKNILLSNLPEQSDSAQTEGLVSLGKMYLANGMWAEARGFFDFAQQRLPELGDNPRFIAMRAAAIALGGESEDAFNDFSLEAVKTFEEIGYWRAFVLADLGDWQQAQQILPDNLDALSHYPPRILNRVGLVVAEVALRSGNVKKGERILDLVEKSGDLRPSEKAALNYLRGEAARQKGDIATTKKLWEPLAKGSDELYRAKTGLALTRLLVDQKELNQKKAIDNLERLRYAWRGDELEAQINYWLGQTYFEAGEYAKGLTIMKDAATFSLGTELGKRIVMQMQDVFTKLYTGADLQKLSPLEAAALFEQFNALVPKGKTGDEMIEKLAEHLVAADLLGRAASLLRNQLDHRLEDPNDIYRVAVRLAAIDLLDREPEKALAALNEATQILQQAPVEQRAPSRILEIALLRARALSQQGRPDQAIEMLTSLPRNPDVHMLRADIAWTAGYWQDAAEALDDVIADRNISLTRPLKAEDARLLLNRATALNLANDRIALANMREKYSDAMAQTDKAQVFEVITRPRQTAALADRETLMSVVSEVDLFKGFLESYKKTAPPTN